MIKKFWKFVLLMVKMRYAPITMKLRAILLMVS